MGKFSRLLSAGSRGEREDLRMAWRLLVRLRMRDPLHWLAVRHKLILLFVGLCLVAFGVGGFLVSRSAKDALEKEILNRLEFQCEAYAGVLDAYLGLLARRSEDFASDGYIRSRMQALRDASTPTERAQLHDELRSHLTRNKLPLVPAFLDLGLLDPQGKPILSVGGNPGALMCEPGGMYPAQAGLQCSDLKLVPEDHEVPTFLISTPVYELEGEGVLGRLVAQVHPGVWVVSSLERSNMAPDRQDMTVSLSLLTSKGARLSIPPRFVGSESPSVDSEIVQSGFGLKFEPQPASPGAAPTRSASDTFLRRFPIATNGWRVQVEVQSSDVLQPVAGLQARFLLVGMALTGVAGLLLFFPLRFLARPLVQLTGVAREIERGNLKARIAYDSGDEVGDLARSFNRMAEALAERTSRLEHTAADLKERGRELQRERDRLNAVLNSMNEGLIVLDAQGHVVLSNAAARPLVERFSQEGISVTGHHVCHKHRTRPDCQACLTDPAGPSRSCLVNAAGQTYEIHTASLRPDERGHAGRVLLCHDITDRVAEDERQIHQERLAVLGEVAAVMAHELNNPLAAISMFSQMLEDELPEDSELREAVDVIRRNTETAKRAIRELLDYGTGACPEVGSIDIHETLLDVVQFLRPISSRSQVQIEVKLDAAEAEISGDEIQIRQVFVNLVMNAIQAMGATGGRVCLSTREEDGHLIVEIADTGPGIPAEVQATVFRPFFTTKARGTGTGLGLPTARRITEMHGGSLELLHSRAGDTRFQVRFRLSGSSHVVARPTASTLLTPPSEAL